MNALRPVIETELKHSVQAAEKRMSEYTARYDDPAAGLAPGQQA